MSSGTTRSSNGTIEVETGIRNRGHALEDLRDLAGVRGELRQGEPYRCLAALIVVVVGQLWWCLVDAPRPGDGLILNPEAYSMRTWRTMVIRGVYRDRSRLAVANGRQESRSLRYFVAVHPAVRLCCVTVVASGIIDE